LLTLNKKYEQLFKSDSRYYVVSGGRGSGKSYSVNSFLLLLTYEVGHVILFTRYTLTSAHVSIIPEFIDKIETANLNHDFYITKDEIVNKRTGSKILFKGIKTSSGNQTANLKSLTGITCFILDEAEELVDEDIFDKIDFSIRSQIKQNRIILVLNPATKESWIYKRFFESKGVKEGSNETKEDTTYIHTTYKDNIDNLSESFLKQIEHTKLTRPEKYNHVIMGGWLDKAEGVVFTNWSFGEFNPDGLQTSCGMDFGFSVDPDTLTEVAIDKSKKKLYVKEHIYKNGIKTHELAPMILSKVGNKLIIADSAEPRLIEDLKHLGVNIVPVKKGTIESGITRMQDYEIIVEPNSTNIAKELNNYAYKDKGSQLYIDDYNHCFIGSTKITTNKGYVNIKDIEIGDSVLTSKGYKKVLKKFDNGIKKVNKYSMQFDTFSLSLVGTENHKIKTTKGWKKLKHLTNKDTLYLNNILTEKSTNFTREKNTFQEVGKECIQRYGKKVMEIYQKDTTSTTLMGIPTIMIYQILILSQQIYILGLRVKKGLKKIKSGLKNFTLKVLRKQKNGTSQKKVKSGIANTEKECGLTDLTTKKNVKNVVKNTKQGTTEFLNTVIKTAKLKQIDVKELQEQKVYDLMVEDCHEYFANDILVHNCIDGIRYNVIYHLDNPNKGNYYIY
jgi:phage terminase large subunit